MERHKKVLIIEPDKVLGDTYKKAIQLGGRMRATVCEDVSSALDVLDSPDIPDLIVCEIQLSQHNGVELLYEVRSHQDWSNIPIIINTIVQPDTIKLDSKIRDQLGVKYVLHKPNTSLAGLVLKINEVI